MPLDERPCPWGRYVIRNGLCEQLARGEQTDEVRYNTHFSSCPIQKKKHNEIVRAKKLSKMKKAVGPPRKADTSSENFKRLTKRMS